jgi:hypothetical protein
MERINKFFGILAIITIIGFVLVGCATTKVAKVPNNIKSVEVPTDAPSTITQSSVTVSVNSLTVNDYAVLTSSDHDGEWPGFWKLAKSGVTSYIKLTDIFTNPVCHIANGMLTVNLGVPKDTALETLSGLGNDNSANAIFFHYFYDNGVSNNGKKFYLSLTKEEGGDENGIYFMYVDKPVTLNKNITNEGRSLAFDNLSLQTGWNIALGEWKENGYLNFSNVTLNLTDYTYKWKIEVDKW